MQTSLEQGGSRAPAGLFLSPIAATAALVSALMLERCSTVMSNGSTPAARDGRIGGGGGADTVELLQGDVHRPLTKESKLILCTFTKDTPI